MKPFSQCLLNNNQVYNIIFKIHNRDSRSVTISSSVTVSPSCNGSASNGMFYQFLLCQFLIILNSCSVVAVQQFQSYCISCFYLHNYVFKWIQNVKVTKSHHHVIDTFVLFVSFISVFITNHYRSSSRNSIPSYDCDHSIILCLKESKEKTEIKFRQRRV